MVYGPGLTRSRVKIFKSQIDQTASPEAGAQIRLINKQLTLFYLVQILLLLFIVYLSVFGSAKHPGVI
jgi:hypothetical protein